MRNDRLIAYLLKQGKLIVDCDTGKVFKASGRELGYTNERGYRVTKYKYRGKNRRLRLHRIVYICVFGLPGHGMEIDHINGIKDENRPFNLEAVTGAANSQRAHKNGQCSYENNHNERCSDGKFRKKLEEKDEEAPF